MTGGDVAGATARYAAELSRQDLATETAAANEQHYEVPAGFFKLVLGSSLKYSCGLFLTSDQGLDEAERLALQVTMERAGLQDGMKILELGCGWGSLTLAMARAFPNSSITAVSNSASQRRSIESAAQVQGLKNITIKTLDLSRVESFDALEEGRYDRIVSVEMFEHFKNYRQLLSRIKRLLKADGKLFVHIFTHRLYSYPFEVKGDTNWMGRHFFTGGQMPARALLREFDQDFCIEKEWQWDGRHYQKTAEAWLKNTDRHQNEILKEFEPIYGKGQAKIWLQRWRVFFLSCAELFGYAEGEEWAVTHYLFSPQNRT